MSRRSDSHRSRSPVLHRRGFSTTLEGSISKSGCNNNPLNLAASLPPTSLMGSLLASQQAKAAEEAKAKEVAAKKASATGSMSAIANAAADMLKSARNASNATGSYIEGALVISPNMDKDIEHRRLDIEMQRRRDRIERWRRERKLKQDILAMQQKTLETARRAQKGKWNLEDDDDEDDALKKPKQAASKADEDEVDPLDAYMQEVNAELRSASSELNKPKPAVKVERGIGQAADSQKPAKTEDGQVDAAKKKPEMTKGELMETNIDELEYSSEEDDETIEDALARLQKKEKVIAVDHSKIVYEPFRKDFYVEVPEIAKMSKEDVKAYRASLENTRVRGKDCPKPIKNWAQTGISSRLLACLKRNKFDKPTPIQCQALPVIMSGRDMIGIAKTGSGKTLAFLVPLMRHIRQQRPLEPGEGPIALLLAPTRELALQIYKEAKKLSQAIDSQVVCVYGGTGISEQIGELKRGAEIIVCTPGRMIDMLAANGGRVTNLRRCTYVVLDEADRMFDLGFEPQVMRVIENCRPDRQTLMFSATFPRQMEFLARKALTSPIEVQVGGRSVVCSDVDQHVVVITEDEKVHKVLELLGVFQEVGSVLIFVEKQESADELMHVLLKYGYPCLSLHGGIDQYDRDSVITDFKRGTIRLLIATSVAARGLDVPELLLVINYDCPNHYEDYVHRCGRTGRAGHKGCAYTFVTPDQERNAGDVVRAFKQSGQKPPDELLAMWNSYKKRMESEGKKVYGSSGFRGKGFMFDENEAQLNTEKRRFQKAALGLQDDSDDEEGDPNAVDWDAKIEDMLGTKRRVKEVPKGPTAAEQVAAFHADLANQANSQTPISAALALARQKAAQLTLNLNLGSTTSSSAGATSTATTTSAGQATTATTSGSKFTATPTSSGAVSVVDAAQATAIAVMQGQPLAAVSTAASTAGMGGAAGGGLAAGAGGLSASRSLAEQAAERLNMKLGYCKLAVSSADSSDDASADGKEEKSAGGASGETVRRFEEELAINDFPQNVRWRVTGREMLSHISEYCDVGISVRGVYMPPAAAAKARQNPSADNDERPLFLCIEAVAERQIASAKKEIMRVIKEELLKSSTSAANRGRYKVV